MIIKCLITRESRNEHTLSIRLLNDLGRKLDAKCSAAISMRAFQMGRRKGGKEKVRLILETDASTSMLYSLHFTMMGMLLSAWHALHM